MESTRKNELRILIADELPVFRAGLKTLLECLKGIKVVGEVGDGRLAFDLIESERPDIVLTEIYLPGLNTSRLIALTAREFPSTHIIVVSSHEEEPYLREAFKTGASGYLSKRLCHLELESAIWAVAQGGVYLSPVLAAPVISGYLKVGTAPEDEPDLLTRRQRDVLSLIAEGLSTQAIGRRLGVSSKTVDSHRAQLMKRLGIDEIAGLVHYAIRTSVVKINELERCHSHPQYDEIVGAK